MTPSPAVPTFAAFARDVLSGFRRPFLARTMPPPSGARPGNGRAVMVIPGFLARDLLTGRLRRSLGAMGYAVEGWGEGANLGLRGDLLDRLEVRIQQLHARAGPVALIGWSLGGLYARELAKRLPDRVDRVITLGSPFSGNPRANRAWRLYERLNDHPVDRPPVTVDLPAKPPVPTWALWSPKDGLVAPASSAGQPDERDHAVMVDCHHIDMVSSPAMFAAIVAALDTVLPLPSS